LPLSDVPNGTNTYIDANIFLFIAFKEKHFDESKNFLKRVHKKEVNGFISIIVLDEVLFKLIQAEPSVTFKIPLHATVQFLKKNPDKIQELTKCWNALEKILSINITILDAPKDFRFVMNNCKEYKLMTRDALHISVMKSNRITNIATADEDFKRVPEIKVWAPLG
jgi:predicted nucleic acid-binding protein